MASTSDLSKGAFIKFNGELVVVLEYEHRTPGNLRAFYQVKMRNIKTGKLVENRFRSGEEIEFVRVETKDYQYLYKESDNLVVMDTDTFEQFLVPKELFGNSMSFLKEGVMVMVSLDEENRPVYAEAPASVELEVTYTEPGVKGDTATKTLKPATLETGAEIRVPLFVNTGDKIKVNPQTAEYLKK